MRRVSRPQLEARTFKVNPQRMFRDCQLFRCMCTILTRPDQCQRIQFARRQIFVRQPVGAAFDLKRFLVQVMGDQDQVLHMRGSEFLPFTVRTTVIGGKQCELPVWPTDRDRKPLIANARIMRFKHKRPNRFARPVKHFPVNRVKPLVTTQHNRIYPAEILIQIMIHPIQIISQRRIGFARTIDRMIDKVIYLIKRTQAFDEGLQSVKCCHLLQAF